MSKGTKKGSKVSSKKANRTSVSLSPVQKYCIFLLLLTTVVYLPSLFNDFTNWDDDGYVVENPMIKGFSAENMRLIFTKQVMGNYHPLTMLSLSLNYAIGGLNPFGYHLVNLLFHLANTLLVFFLARRLGRNNWQIGLITAVLFAIHPMHVESVAWVAERKDVLYTFFFLFSLWFYIDYATSGKKKPLIWSLLTFALALLSKPAAVALAPTLVIVDLFLQRKIDRSFILDKIPYFGLAVLMGFVTIQTQDETSAIGDFEVFTIWQRITFGSYGIVQYFSKMIVPIKLAAFYPYEVNPIPFKYKIAPLFALLISALFLMPWWGRKFLLFGYAFFLINIALVLQVFISVGDAIIADRYTYVPFIGLFFSLACIYAELKSGSTIKKISTYALGLHILLFSILCFKQNQVWENNVTLWNHAVKHHPSRLAHNNLGHHYRQNSELETAIFHYNEALKIDPDYHLALSNRGKVYFDWNRNEEALADYSKALKIKPDQVAVLSNRGAVLARMKRYDEALADFNRALEIDPEYPEALLNRGILHFTTKKMRQCIADYDKYLKLVPNRSGTYNDRAVAYQHLGNHEQAVIDFSKAIELDSQKGNYYLNRSYSYSNLGKLQAALKDARAAQRLGLKVSPEYLNQITK